MSPIIYFLTCFLYLHATAGDKVIFENLPPDITNYIFLCFVQGPTANDYVRMKLEDGLNLPNLTGFDVLRETVFFFHGWGEGLGVPEESVNAIATAYLQSNFVNLVICDYSDLVKFDNKIQYADAVINATYIGEAFGQYFKQYVHIVQLIKFLHLVSHSLGSQIMSKAARTYGAGCLPWLTAVDAAGPGYDIAGVDHLTAADGLFVDVMHTDGGVLGEDRTIGTVDFFPNGGCAIQPGCLNTTVDVKCSHQRSWRYYAESVTNRTAFPAKKCDRTPLCDRAMELCSCSKYGGEFTYIGPNVNKNARGTYYLRTNAKSPYGQGAAGMNFSIL